MDYKIVEKSKRQKRLIKIDIITSGLYIILIALLGVRLYFTNYHFGYFKTINSNWNSRGINKWGLGIGDWGLGIGD